jgi:hypothetical protein
MYIDEVGNSDLGSSDDPNHKYLSLTGVIIDQDYCAQIVHPQLEDLKRRYFSHHPDEPVVFHRKEMVNAQGPFSALQEEQIRDQFNTELLNLLAEWNYIVITVCIDKKRHKDTYTTWRFDPYHYSLTVLIERYVFFLNQTNTVGDIMAESRGGKEDRRLKDSFNKLWENGTEFVESEQFQRRLTSRQLKVKNKTNNIAGLQIADLIAHPSRNEIMWDERLITILAPFGKKITRILQSKYYRRNERIYGKKML